MALNKKNAFLFVSHEIDEKVVDRYFNIERSVKDFGESFFLFNQEQNSDDVVIPTNIKPYIFRVDSLNELDYEPIAETITPGSNHFATLQFFLDNPDFEHYWVIEYDVIYTGRWTDLFRAFDLINVDFIASHIERFPDKPFWHWWDTLHLESVTLQKHQLIRSFIQYIVYQIEH